MNAPPESLEPDLSGQLLDRYHLIRRLGVGGMGAVYEAEHTQLRKHFAVKLLRQEFARNQIARQRFLREARAASAITHPHVVDISDFGETRDGNVYFVMELLAGRDLQRVLDTEGRMSWPRTQQILTQVASALAAAHQQGIIHRDIKPSNCFLAEIPGQDEGDFVKVVDFGIAKLGGKLGKGAAQLTSTDEIFGTVAYMAPEMATGTSDDFRSDIYALGIMMYRMLVGSLPFYEGNAYQILNQHIHDRPPLPREQEPSIPEDVEAIILRAIAKKPKDRFTSMEEFGRALRLGELPAPGTETGASVGEQTTMMLRKSEVPPRPVSIDKTMAVSSSVGSTAEPATATPSAESSGSTVVLSGEVDPLAATTPPRPDPTVLLESSGENPVETPMPAPPASGSLATSPSGALDTAVPGPATVQVAARPSRLPWIVASALGLALLGVGAVFVLDRSSEDPSVAHEDQTPAPAASLAPPTIEPHPSDAPAPEPTAPPPEAEPTTTSPPDEPAEPTPADAPAPAEVSPEPPEPPPAKAPTGTKPRPKPKPKPKSDATVVKQLRAKIIRKCKDQGDTRVKIEGVISSNGRVTSPYITPPTGLGACAKKVVKAARFDASRGVRPMPRFSVKL